jgi:hypothetical protein
MKTIFSSYSRSRGDRKSAFPTGEAAPGARLGLLMMYERTI